MGKLFNHKKRHFSDDNFSDEKEENDELESDEIEAEEIEDEDEEAEGEDSDENSSDEKEEKELNFEEIEDDELEEDEQEIEELVINEPEEDEQEIEELVIDEPEEDEQEIEELVIDEPEEDESEAEEVEADEINEDEEVSLTDEDTEKVDRRYYRRKRRIRNQIITYGVMSIFLAILIVIGAFAGRKIAEYVKEKRQAEEMAALLEQQKEELEQQAQQEEEHVELVIETPPADDIVEVPTPEEQLEEYVNMCISEMPLEDRVASLFIVTPEALTGVGTVTQAGDATKDALSKCAVGGLVYFDKNIKSREQLTEMLSTTASNSKYPLFLAVDEEGGSVSRIGNSNIDVVKVDEMSVIGTSQDAVAAREAGTTIGTYLKELGFNLDFAPVADVVTDAGNSVLGSRSFGTDASVAAEMVSHVVDGMQEAGVNACLKHFPGMGSAEEDTHDGRVEITRTLEEMRNSDFLPFQSGIEAGANIVMVSHVTASAIDTEGLPSSLSKVVITNVLRGELGFEGVVITDALDMSAISEYYTADEAAVMAITAGADMLLKPEDFDTAYNGLLAAVQEGVISEERINESLRRIYRIKYADKIMQ